MFSSTYCDGTCRATVRAPGYTSTGCRNQTWQVTEEMLRHYNSSWGIGLYGGSSYGLGGTDEMNLHPTVYSVIAPDYFQYCRHGREPMFLSTGYLRYTDCQGQLSFSNCTMMTAVLNYEITIQGNTITYSPPSIFYDVAEIAENYCTNDTNLAITGLLKDMYPNTFSNASMGYLTGLHPGEHPIALPDGATFSAFAWSHIDMISGGGICSLTAYDPMDDIITELNDTLFRSGLIAGSWANITELLADSPFSAHQTVEATRSRDENVFHSDFRWFLGAVAIQILTMLLILPAYHGWWNIGVELTLSPFHTAKAFNAPLCSEINSAAGSAGLINETGDMRLKLGAIDVRKSEQVAVTASGQKSTYRSQVGIDVPERVVRPRKGATFSD